MFVWTFLTLQSNNTVGLILCHSSAHKTVFSCKFRYSLACPFDQQKKSGKWKTKLVGRDGSDQIQYKQKKKKKKDL